METPLLIVVSAPSGAGKTTLCEKLLAEKERMHYSVSCTTRAPRGDEVNGEDYLFMDTETFEARVDAGDFAEHAVVHGHRYGTLWSTLDDALARGESVLMDIDVQGAAQMRAAMSGDGAARLRGRWVDIFIAPPSMEALRQRLEGRGEDGADVIEQRLRNAAGEMAQSDAYRYVVINDEIERAYAELLAIIEAEQQVSDEEGR